MTTERTAIVTGGGRGIGRAAAVALAADGWNIVVAGRTAGDLDSVVKTLERPGLAVEADVSRPDAVDALFAAATASFGRVDLLFNNAGIAAPVVPVDELSVEQWLDVVNINLTGSFLCARAAFAQMKRQDPQGGRIINNGSVSAAAPRPMSAPYTATKHGITGLTKSLALDGRGFGITCGQLDLGNVASEMVDEMVSGTLQADGTVRSEPTTSPDHAASAVVYMANLPPDANVLQMTVMASEMPFVGRG